MRAGIRRFRAPGRVNLIGDHTDYNDGFVLPMAIDHDCVTLRRDTPGARGTISLDGDQESLDRFVAATVATIEGHGARCPEAVLAVRSDVPVGAGLSSSAALAVCLMRALTADLHLDPIALARWARDAEELATGVASGLMDQLTSACGIAGQALLIDCAALDLTPVALPDALGIAVVHSGISRILAASAYLERRGACEDIAARLGLRSLREATFDAVAGEPLARHVVTENARVLDATEALRAGDLERLGALALASHASLRDDFAVSTPELDLLVDLLVDEGALGARLTGAGFGGCVIGFSTATGVEDIGARAVRRYERETGRDATVFVPRATEGASEITDEGRRP
jgi:galactokinase